MDTYSELPRIEQETIHDMSTGEALQSMLKWLHFAKLDSLQGLQFTSLELIVSENQDSVSLVLTVKKF